MSKTTTKRAALAAAALTAVALTSACATKVAPEPVWPGSTFGKSMDPVPTTTSRAAACDRACLEGYVDKYFAAVIDDAPEQAPISPKVRFTENGVLLPVGEGLWKSMKAAGKYRLFVTDADAGQVTLITTVVEDVRDPQGGQQVLMALRLKVEDGLITEIEQLLDRPTSTAPGPGGRPAPTSGDRVEALGAPREAFLTAIPEAERRPRAELISQADKYFSGMQLNDGKGDYPFGDRCDRIENGGRSTNVPTATMRPVSRSYSNGRRASSMTSSASWSSPVVSTSTSTARRVSPTGVASPQSRGDGTRRRTRWSGLARRRRSASARVMPHG